MKKLFKVLFVAILAIAVAAPAMADIKVNGYMRTQMQSDTVGGFGASDPYLPGAKDADTQSAIDHRFRAKITNQLTDEVQWVFYGEVDDVFGGSNFDLGADSTNVQVKNVYMSFNVPNTIYSFALGVQGFSLGFDGMFIADDAAGIKANLAIAPNFDLGFQYAKFEENTQIDHDDFDYYAAQGKFKLVDDNKLTLTALFLDDNSDQGTLKDEAMGLGAEFNGKFGGVGLNAWAYYTDFTENDGDVTEVEGSGIAASVQAVMGKAAVRFTYLQGDDTGPDFVLTDIGGNFALPKENLMIMLTDYYYNNLGSTAVALDYHEATGLGLMAINAKYDAMVGDYYLKLGAGYFLAAEDNIAGEDELGFEVAARMGRKVAEKVDVSLGAAYASAGDAFDTGAGTDDMYKVNFMVNLPF